MHEIRFCRVDEHQLLVDFLDQHWKKKHIFVLNKDLLDWQHLDVENDRYNFVVAYNKKNNQFDAILGFIPTYKFDFNSKKFGYIWLAIWKIKEEATTSISGVSLLLYLNNKLKPKTICAIGITDGVKGIYQAFKYKVENLIHYYIRNSKVLPTISSISNITSIEDRHRFESEYFIESIDNPHDYSNIFMGLKNSTPHKTFIYITNRYINHPIYKYFYYGIFKNNVLISFFISRKVIVNGASCIRIVDWVGEFPRSQLFKQFEKILVSEEAEYIDLLCMHNQDVDPTLMGFSVKTENQIIPEYFDPFVRRNVSISFAYKGDTDNYFIFKGDSDQDRPNSLSI